MVEDALALQDILENVLLLADESTLVSCSTVNKCWSKSANKCLWKSLNSVRPLLELLAPLIDSSDMERATLEFDYTKPISWERFNVYAPLVKHLSISASEDQYAKSVLSVIGLWRPSLSLLPRLQELEVDCHEENDFQGYFLDFAILFLGEDITSITVSIENIAQISTVCGSGHRTFQAFLHAIAHRSPFLRHFKFRCITEYELCNVVLGSRDFMWTMNSFMKLLPSLFKIETISFCPLFAFPAMVAILSNLESLKGLCLRCHRHIYSDTETKASTSLMRPPNTQHSPFALESLVFDVNYTMANRFLCANTPLMLRRLDIRAQDFEDAYVQGLISRIGMSCRRLEELRLRNDCECPQSYNLEVDFGKITKHLINLTQMKSLSFFHCFQWRIHEDDFEELVSHWPLLEELHLIHCLKTGTTLPLNSHALTKLAKYCPNIRQVTLPVEFDHCPLSSMILNAGGHIDYKFPVLQRLNLRIPPIDESTVASQAIAAFLAGLSIPGSALTISHDLLEDGPDPVKFLEDVRKLMVLSSHYIQGIRHLQDRVASLEALVRQIRT